MGKTKNKPQQQTKAPPPPSSSSSSPPPAAVSTYPNTTDPANFQAHVLTTSITMPVGMVLASEHELVLRKLHETERQRQLLLEEYNGSLKQLSESKLQVEALQQENRELKASIYKLKTRIQELESNLQKKNVEIATLQKRIEELNCTIRTQANDIEELKKEAELRKQRLILGEVGFSIERRLREKMSINDTSCTISKIRRMADAGELSSQALTEWNNFVDNNKWDVPCDTILCQLKDLRLPDAHGNHEDLKKISKEDLLDFADIHLEQDADYANANRVINILEMLTPPSQSLLYIRPSRPPRRSRATKRESTSAF